ncbi:MAG TPA: wax ester/triacylglycerol synthase family O-acyltransferase [Solirubrobacteraceae bacterium]|jgi:WS/DGAT/MGAT family acyltransferase|nr:wax ester/triacylglycerol synthase family O-acyltransferase [Solirubrobacteraceae bacterium]
MPQTDRLTGLDSSFLHLEGGVAHMHVGACAIFDGPIPAYEHLVGTVQSRLHLVPRYRQRLAFVPLDQGRPVWVDDPQFRLPFHVRHTALPKPGSDAQLRRLAGRIFSQGLDRGRPLWELWLIEGLSDGRFALLSKTHHALVDGISGVDIASVIFDSDPDPQPVAPPPRPWVPRPLPTPAQLLADALLERTTVPGELVRGLQSMLRQPRELIGRAGATLSALGALTWAGLEPAPGSPFNVPIGPHRRFTWVEASLAEFRQVKDALGGTINDVVLAAVSGAIGSYMRRHELDTDGLVLTALVPVSVRGAGERGALGNRIAAMWAPLPVGIADPVERLATISEATAEIKRSGQAIGAQALAELSGFASPTLVAQAARLQARQRLFNLVVTNVPGPQMPLYLLGRRMRAIYPLVPLAANTALGIAVMSYDGGLDFGLNADYDALADLEPLADDLRAAIKALGDAANAAVAMPV